MIAPPSQGIQSAAVGGEESSPAAATAAAAAAIAASSSSSPAPSGSSSVPGLTRTDSTPSSDRVSLSSHISVPVTGTFPLGSLRVHGIMDSPRPTQPQLENTPQDIFLILDLPENSTVGCDAKAIGTGSSGFQGIRDIPLGPHFIWVSEPNAMSRCGYWFVTKGQGQVRVKQWDKFNEVLINPASNFEVRNHKDNMASLYPLLVQYGYGGKDGPANSRRPTSTPTVKNGLDEEDEVQLWGRLTSCINEKVLGRVTARTNVGEWLVDTSDSAAGEAAFPQAKTTKFYQTLVPTPELNFLFPEGDIDLHATTNGSTASDRDVVDTSLDILRLVETPGTGVADADLVGELQLTFLTGLHLSNLACIDQWWHLVLKVVLRAHQLILLRPSLSLRFLQVLHAQMVYNETYITSGPSAEFEDDEPRHEYGGPAGSNGGSTSILDIVPGNKKKLRAALTLYKRRMNEILLDLPATPTTITAEQSAVGQTFVELEAWFWRFGWDLRTDYVGTKKNDEEGNDEMVYDDDDDDDEYRPVIVDLDENGREVGLVSFT